MAGTPEFTNPASIPGVPFNGAGPNYPPNPNAANILNTGTIVISSAELLALHGTPQTIVPAPGAGNAIVVTQAIYEIVPAGTGYAGSGLAGLYYGNASTTNNGADNPPPLSFWSQTANTFRITNAATVNVAGSVVVNEPLIFGTNGSLTGGNGALTLNVTYQVVPAT